MPLGNPRDFGLVPEDDPILDVEAQAENRDVLGIEEENLGHDDPFEDAVVGEYLGEPGSVIDAEAAEQLQLLAYLNSLQPQYVVTPADLCGLVASEIITTEEARAYLESKGVIG